MFRDFNPGLEGQSYVQYRALLISLGLHLFLLMFEVLVADNLQNHRHAWVSVFSPLILISIISIAACIWAVKHDRSFELELFCSVNLLQFIFIALRLDEYIKWPWEIVFVPAWILMCVSIVAVLYSIVFAGLLLRMPDVNHDRRRTSMNSAIGYTCLVAPLLIFLITLTSKMNGNTTATYTSVASPLYISYMTLIIMSFSTKRANQWWFGLRKDLCQFLLGVCPLLQEYANISYSMPHAEDRQTESVTSIEGGIIGSDKKDGSGSHRLEHRVVVPAVSLEVPD
ncbi:transmembrane protein 185B-like isoform X3 [Macrobrachium nipponense]|uniref:transmembrane protein 185B-like isoform X3 n=1 Tax=Macrobrachium nipponense TaxID=159736 RepID=UPI0030C82850